MDKVNQKQNAKEYLKCFADKLPDDWLKALIYEVIETNGSISDDKKKEIFNALKGDIALTINNPNINNDNSVKEICLTSLEHIKGVNALKQNQTIKFHKNVTILYGLNGAGKSSYFKILNEIAGGNEKKEVLKNIYLEAPQEIDVNILFQEKTGEIQTVNWDGTNRSLDFLNKCKVFDSSYLDGLLVKRKSDTTLIQPLGLNLFSYLVNLIDEFKNELNTEADKKRLEKPTLDLKYLSGEIKQSFEMHRMEKEKQIKNLFVFADEKCKKLKGVELHDLKQTNIQDKIELKKSDKTDIGTITTYIENIHKQLSYFDIETQKELPVLAENKKKNELAKKQFEILSTIPNSDNSTWKEFIKSGEKYKSKVDDSDEFCIYCRQPLQHENASDRIKAYGDFLRDESEQELNDSLERIKNLERKVEILPIELEIKDNIKNILKEKKIEATGETLFNTVVSTNMEFCSTKEKLVEKLKNEDLDSKISLDGITNVIKKLNSISESIQAEIDNLSEKDSKKANKIEVLEKSLKQLEENESISKQEEDIKNWLKINEIEKSLRGKASKINTTHITILSKQAHNALLTEALKKKFIVELKSLGCQNLNVKIESAKSEKGTSSTKLTLSKNNDVKVILSEGEQKAVALALFIAESKIQKNKNPIILDDPVNSLDHKIAGKFAEILLKLDNQVILFSHNRLFLDVFETSNENHICKTIDSDCNNSKGRHIRVYKVNSESQNEKGVLINYKSNKAKNHISDAKDILKNSPFEDKLTVASLLRRAVECVIDEVIFNNQLPTKCGNKNSRIDWAELKKLKNDGDTIDKLKTIYGRVSGAELHNGIESEENPIELSEFNKMVSDLEKILNKEAT